MKFSQLFCPILKEQPKDAVVPSHILLIKAGFIRQTASGIYTFLPLAMRVLNKLTTIINQELIASGAQPMLMPTLQSSSLWQESNRYNDYGQEMLKLTDRHGRELIYGPTNEEQITDIFRNNVKTYKALPLNLYQIQWKFRDEIRPRFGLLRGREFLMKDAYSFDLTEEESKATYLKMFLAYLKIFNNMGIFAIPMPADTGPIGGKLSHEFIILTQSGESNVYVDKNILTLSNICQNYSYDSNLEGLFSQFSKYYAATEDVFDSHNQLYIQHKANIISTKGIEVGQLFYFGTKYSEPMHARVLNQEGREQLVYMGSYGIGVSRLISAIVEANHDQNGIYWPEQVAPFKVIINCLGTDNEITISANKLYQQLNHIYPNDILINDSSSSVGAKLGTADLIGIPWQINIGKRSLVAGKVELKHRKTNKIQLIAINDLEQLNNYINQTTINDIF